MTSPRSRTSAQGNLRSASPIGVLLKEWRHLRHVSQLALSLETRISQRHLSFIESGRSRPSRDMVLRIAQALELPLRAQNELLAAAGYTPVYQERPLDAEPMERVRGALERILRHHEPYPAMVLDRYWNILMRNEANVRVVGYFVDADAFAQRSPGGKLNFVRLMFAADGLRPHVKDWETAAPLLMARVRREARANPSSPSAALAAEFASVVPAFEPPHASVQDLPAAAPLVLERDDITLSLINMLTTFGTAQDVGVQELRVEMSFPNDAATDRALRGR